MTVRESSAAVSLFVLLLAYGAYGVWLLQGPHTVAQTLGVVVGGVVLIGVVSVAVAVPVAIYVALQGRRDDPADERDRLIGSKSVRNAYWVVLCTLWIIPFLALIAPPVLTANVALLTLGLAEVVNYGSRLLYYRAGG